MAIRKYKPTTPGRRGASGADFAEITRGEPEKSLVRPLHSQGGRNVHGRITARHQGGGHKRAYRLIDFRRADKDGVPAKVAHLEYDPNRTARLALLHDRAGRATGGEVGNAEQGNIKLGKAGRSRWKGRRPSVRGVAMNPVDHPLGGGEGKSSGGRHPVSPWGKPEGRTRQANKSSDRMI